MLKVRKKLFLRQRNIFIIFISLFLLLIFKPASSFKNNGDKNEKIRGVWMTNVGVSFLHHTSLLDNVFNHLASSGYNRIYVSTYGFGGTIYPSKQVKSILFFVPPFTNILKASEKKAKRQDLKLYAWLEYGLMLSPEDEIALKHPEYLLKTDSGKTIINGFVWLNPEHPEVQKYILAIISEVAQYNITGIQLDDHWSTPSEFGNKTQAMTKLTAKVRQHLKEINPKIILSLSPNPYNFSLNKYNQDWLNWAKKGYIDEVVIQIYRPNSAQVKQAITTSKINYLPDNIPVGIGIFAGNFDNFLHPEEIQKQIAVAEKFGYGYSIFCWEYEILGSLTHYLIKSKSNNLK
ncbi:MAG: family 10 glycosylhydrolase [Cyanobacteria bacterium]|nr:family 10 glycosylhydrolase [Cyanobacteria bacterium CG_2015-16_32_12]NCQ40563.1 family 10 glycosylhydrolase [Cyanobacteria bacterium CG_2015-04_32_10]NCS85361.1 family 10 glycosylhydrolase [Cyanobacteria bacterium CG_2015-02_32_10]